MHFTIPYTEEVLDSNGKKIDIFKIYINGAHHCSARFSRLYKLYEDLKLRFPVSDLPYFPPKKFFKINESQLEERRESLEFFLQKVSSSNKFNSDELHDFLKTCQKETKKIVSEPVKLSVYLMDGQKHELDVWSTDNTKTVFEAFADVISLPRKISSKFSLFFMVVHPDMKFSIIRKLQDFEYPYVSLYEIQKLCNCRIVVRKSVWNIELESEIDSHNSGLEILFAQVSAEIVNGWISIPDEARMNRIQNLIERKARKETLQLARTLSYYGYMQLHGTSVCNRPLPNTMAIVSTGNFEIVFRDEHDDHVLMKYYLTRIKAWKISTALKEPLNDDINQSVNQSQALSPTLTFEYLDIETKKLDEVVISNNQTDQIILLSMSLKNMAEEYVCYKSSNSSLSDVENGEKMMNTSKFTSNDSYKPAIMCSLYIGDGDL